MSWAIEHQGLIRTIAHRVHRRARAAGASIELEDLIQDGCEVAIKAQSGFDDQRGYQPSTYLFRALMRHLNLKVDCAIQHRYHEQQGLEIDHPADINGDDLNLRDFLKPLSRPAQRIVLRWLDPGDSLGQAIKDRTVGRRCSMKALVQYLGEQGHDADRLKRLEREIFTQASHHES